MMSEVLVLGGGLAGASAALQLARAHFPVRLFERETGPHHKICGEFLSVEAQRDLCRLGLDPARLGAIPIDRVRVIKGRRQIEAPLPFLAQGLSRKCLDEALLEAAEREGVQVERGVRVTGLEDREVCTSAGRHRARSILLATGKRDVRGTGRAQAGAGKYGSDYVGFKMHWRLDPRHLPELRNAIELVIFDGGYAGLQCVADDVLNLCLIVCSDRLADAGGNWEGLLADLMGEPHLARRLGEAEALFARPLTIANLPYGYVCDPASPLPEGVFRLGDQAALTAPLTGDGMAIALQSSKLAVACLEAGDSPREFHRKLQGIVATQVSRAMFLQRAAAAPLAVQAALGLLALWPALLGKMASMTRLAERRLI